MTKTTPLDPNRLYWIDAVRSFACLCVITSHAPLRTVGGSVRAAFNYYSVAGASILFFMISGALVLYKPKPVLPFLRTRLSRIVFPMICWTLISLLVEVFSGKMDWDAFWQHIVMIPFGPQVGTYWFIYVIFGIYLMTPIMATWLERCSKRDLEFYLGVWAITLFVPYTYVFKKTITFQWGYLYSFYGFLWFAVMGYYLRRYVNIPRFKPWHWAVFIGLLLLPALLYALGFSHQAIHDRMSINVVALCVCYFVILKHLNYSGRMKRLCYNFAQHSFGIYLVHIIVMRSILWPIMTPWQLNDIVQIPLTVALTAIISYCIVKLFSFLPYSKYLVGV